MTDLVDQIFPPIHRKWAPEFTDFNYWKVPVQDFTLPDLTPPSPALSARSDTSSKSALARIRNFSLVGSRHSETRHLSLPPPVTSSGRTTPEVSGREQRSSELKQMSSFERLNSTLFSLTGSSTSWKEYRRQSVSPSSSSTCLDSEEEDEPGADNRAEKRPQHNEHAGLRKPIVWTKRRLQRMHLTRTFSPPVKWKDCHSCEN